METGLHQVVVLVRHGAAVDRSIDPARPLSPEGREHAETAAAWLAAIDLELEEVRHSGKARAQQTAEVIAARLGKGADALRAVPGLAPEDDVEPVAGEIETERRSLALVGHLPFMARLASRLLVGDRERLTVRFADAGVLVLGRSHGPWHLIAHVSHEVLPAKPGS